MPLGEKQYQLDREMRDMMSALTRRLTHLHTKSPMATDGAGEEADGGVGIITMAGNNEGATMRGELEEPADHDPFTTYLNNNFQGVNNSIMMGGSYTANDPGIHLDVDDHYHQSPATNKLGKKKKKAHSGSSTTDHSS